MKTKKVAFLGLSIALAMVLSFLESQVPPLLIPGVKVGLPNLVVVYILYKVGAKEAAIVSLIRVLLISLLFGNLQSFAFAASGAALSLLGMILLKRFFASVTVSIIGGVLHNVGQIAAAILITSTPGVITYLPILLISGTLAGAVIGLVAGILVKRIPLKF